MHYLHNPLNFKFAILYKINSKYTVKDVLNTYASFVHCKCRGVARADGGGGLPPFLSKIVEQLWKTKTDKYYIYMKVYTSFKLEDIL